MGRTGILALEDGRIFRGLGWGAEGERVGEIVFNTSLTGYQEILTDPSYAGQIVTMTYPLIGNYGVNSDDIESRRPYAEGLIVREFSEISSNWRSSLTLDQYLRQNGIVGLSEIDTRALVRHIREKGAMRGCLSSVESDEVQLIDRARNSPHMLGRNLVDLVTCESVYTWPNPAIDRPAESHSFDPLLAVRSRAANLRREGERPFRVVAFDFGIKFYILRYLAAFGCEVTVVPARTTAAEVLAAAPDGVFLSNGPGDPAALTGIVDTVRALIGQIPIFGICLGHQILALALGAGTYKLKYGHRGGNQPVRNLQSGRIEITSHNHGFAVDADSLDLTQIELTHVNLNDSCLEGFRHRTLPLFSVQYHPEAGPGPHDATYLFEDFINLMRGKRAVN
ncbi:MAG: carbamoyl-phosphate synthase small subunit [Acidobacteria bacterium]|nr:carbamoyl-phosphate synthase small subunit [Acidobacteriota bacterium]